jgi:hypothetical protein
VERSARPPSAPRADRRRASGPGRKATPAAGPCCREGATRSGRAGPSTRAGAGGSATRVIHVAEPNAIT